MSGGRGDAAGPGGGPRLRLFVALDLPDEVRGALHEWAGRAMAGVHEARLVRPEALHVTLCFIGYRSGEEATEIGELAVAGAASVGEPLALAVGDAIALPPRRPRVVAVEVADRAGALGRLQAQVEQVLVEAGLHEPEKRRFRPHVTVARLRGAVRLEAATLAPPPRLSFRGAAVTLYRSTPGRGGSVYEPLARVGLAGR